TGDLWSAFNGVTSGFTPVYVPAGGSATITVQITPNGTAGSTQSGTLYVDDVTLAGLNGVFDLPNGDEVAAIPYSYRIRRVARKCWRPGPGSAQGPAFALRAISPKCAFWPHSGSSRPGPRGIRLMVTNSTSRGISRS
ncbi:MAG TPA: hypothetical protein VK823_10385, partial [Streptosporangiaceae bacterium]|nr:hypothetical protein [Streptosporangiaceae bacterium]